MVSVCFAKCGCCFVASSRPCCLLVTLHGVILFVVALAWFFLSFINLGIFAVISKVWFCCIMLHLLVLWRQVLRLLAVMRWGASPKSWLKQPWLVATPMVKESLGVSQSSDHTLLYHRSCWRTSSHSTASSRHPLHLDHPSPPAPIPAKPDWLEDLGLAHSEPYFQSEPHPFSLVGRLVNYRWSSFQREDDG